MNALTSVKLIRKYANCKNCGSDKLGNGEGTLEIEDNTLKRTCKCGWSVEVDENDKTKVGD